MFEDTYSVTTWERLRELCVSHNWFTRGNSKHYKKLFYANEHGCPIEEIATIIWLCSSDEWCRRDILSTLQNERNSYLNTLRTVADITEGNDQWN